MTHGVNIKRVFSDDEEEEEDSTAATAGAPFTVPSLAAMTHTTTGFVDPMLSSTAYHIHQAESALASLKQIWREDAKDGWKKALKHKKSGVVVHIKNEKTPIFRGEAVIHGFSPQSIFYVIGMRRLWDELYDDGNLVENLNDTTSLTYEVCKATSSLCTNSMNRPRDMALVEKIECTRDGAIFFACTSVETPCVPRVQGRVRAQIKGWILQPIRGSPLPATRVTYVIQENIKGWVPGFAKKSFARRPLVIAQVNEYLEKKANRMRAQKIRAAVAPSSSVLDGTSHRFQSTQRPSIISPGPTQHQQQGASTSRKRITFVEDELAPPRTVSPASDVETSKQGSALRIDPPTSPLSSVEQKHPSKKQHSLYPPHRHLARKNEAMSLVKRLGMSLDPWVLIAEDNGFRTYTLMAHEQLSDPSLFLPSLTRIDRSIEQDLTAEQLCSIVQCFGARKLWDSQFLDGRILERFSQKDYLVEWKLVRPTPGHGTAITSIDTDPTTGVITAMTCGIGRDTDDFDGWVFRPNQQNRKTVDLSWISTTLADHHRPMPRLKALEGYIAKHGCPPYIRRVAGKVMDEAFDSETGVYSVTLVAKHELPTSHSKSCSRSNDGHHRRGHWCTDIRVHGPMYPAGFSIGLTPEAGTRLEMTPSTSSLRVYTTSVEMEGKPISLRILPNANRKHQVSPQFTLNGVSFVPRLATNLLEPAAGGVAPVTPPQNAVLHPSTAPADTAVLQQHGSPSSDAIPPPLPQQQPVAPAPCHAKPPSATNIKKITRLSSDRLYQQQQVLFIPEGYKLIPQQHNTNIIIISDELTFNGQQLAVVFLAMVLSYYMGKLASASAYC